MAAFDSQLMFREAGALTQDESSDALTVYGTPTKGMAVRVHVATDADRGADDTIQAILYSSTDGSTYSVIAQSTVATPGTDGIELYIPFAVKHKTYLKLELLITATTPSTAFTSVAAGIVQGVGFEWDRLQPVGD